MSRMLRNPQYRRRNTKISKESGFTLLELMIAVFVLVLMSLIIWQLTSRAVFSRKRQADYADIYRSARIAMRKITDDLTMAYIAGPVFTSVARDGSPVMETAFIGEDNGDRDAVHFNTFSHMRLEKDVHESDQAEVSYFTVPAVEGGEGFVLMRRETPIVDEDVKEGGRAFPISEGVKSFNIEYYNQVINEWVGSWNSKDPRTRDRLPRAARIRLVYSDPASYEKEIVLETTVLLPLYGAAINF